MTKDCARAEVLAGAVALGEATDAERDAYRLHLSGCGRCIAGFGGEREIERVMQTVTLARDAERWEPDIRSAFTARANRKRRFWTLGVSTVAAAFVASLAVHAFVASRIVAPAPLGRDAAAVATAFHVTLERRTGVLPVRSATHALPVPRLVVVHNVVTLARPVAAPPPAMHVAVASARSASGNAQRPAGPTFVKSEQVAALGPSRHDEGTIAAMQTAATADPAAQRAESIAVVPTIVHDVMPLGGEDAIVPHPSAIAYDEGAQGTAAFDVNVDERGTPTKCTITKTSGWLVLDVSVCKAAMRARYVPRSVNGKAVAGVYHDAFTFRAGEGE